MKNLEKFFLLLIYFVFLSDIHSINSLENDEVGKHLLMNYRKEISNKGNNLSPDKYMEELMYKQYFSKYNIGVPSQKIKFYYEINSFESTMSEDYYLKTRSTTYKCMDNKKCPKKISENNDFTITDKEGYLSQETFELNTDNKLEDFTFLLKPKGKIDSGTNAIPSIIGLGMNNNKKNKEQLSFMDKLKKHNYIDKKIFTPLTNADSFNENRFFDGQILVGILPHVVNPFFVEKDLKWISMKDNINSNNKNWHINFDTVKYNNEIIKEGLAYLDLSLNVVIGPESFRQKLLNGFLKKQLGNKKCIESLFYNLKDEEPYIYYSCGNDAEFLEIPKLSFYSKIMNETFVISFDQIFTQYKGRFYLNIVFRKKVQNNWVLGQVFLNNYKFVFDTEEERIGYYKTKQQVNHPFVALFCIVVALFIFFIIYLNGNKFFIGQDNIYYNQEMQNKLYPQERKEYSNDTNNNTKKENKKSNKKEKED